jgi:hypothetical protein
METQVTKVVRVHLTLDLDEFQTLLRLIADGVSFRDSLTPNEAELAEELRMMNEVASR